MYNDSLGSLQELSDMIAYKCMNQLNQETDKRITDRWRHSLRHVEINTSISDVQHGWR
jgi:hypothetical protein